MLAFCIRKHPRNPFYIDVLVVCIFLHRIVYIGLVYINLPKFLKMSQYKMSVKKQGFDEFSDKQVIISGQNIHKTYLFGLQGVAALRGVSVTIKQGEFVIILGNSGGGKTSLLNILGTIDKQTKGNLQMYGEKIRQSTNDEILSGLRLNYLGFVFQTFNLISSLTAKQNVQLPMILKGELKPSEISDRAQELLKSVRMSHRLKHFPNQLSGGEQQRVTIARALANRPKMLLLDQPTGDLDSKNTYIVLDILLRLNVHDKITLLMVTHDVNLKCYSHRVLRVLDGKIIGQQFISPQVRQNHIKQLKNIVEAYQNSQFQKPVIKQIDKQLKVRKAEQYGPIKWLRQKQIRDKIEKEMILKVKNQLNRLNMQMSEEAEGQIGKNLM